MLSRSQQMDTAGAFMPTCPRTDRGNDKNTLFLIAHYAGLIRARACFYA
jgi:hypothetical protein